LLFLALPALIIGIASGLTLWIVDELAHALEHWIWDVVPESLGFATDAWWWTLGILTLTGLAVGLVVWLVPGHGGHDSATVELVAPVLPLRALPSIVVVVVLALAGGVSLGPESPIIAINAGLAVALLARFLPNVPHELTFTMAAAGTIGALFGTPVAAALVFTGIVAAIKGGGSLWDKLFLPLVSAGAGSITMQALGVPPLSIGLPAYDDPQVADALIGVAIAGAAALFAIIGALAFPHVHRLFHNLKHPVIYITLGGFVLGLLGIIGGQITMFKGTTQMLQLVSTRDEYTAGGLVLIIVVKLVALVVAASAGFRGGRIFPAVFIGVAIGVLANSLIPMMPLTLAVACAVLGVVLVVSRDGWIALFIAVMVSGDLTVLPLLVLIVLPTWLITRSAPEMIVHPATTEVEPEPTR
jgi:H+/Cl- antiporter ClcA